MKRFFVFLLFLTSLLWAGSARYSSSVFYIAGDLNYYGKNVTTNSLGINFEADIVSFHSRSIWHSLVEFNYAQGSDVSEFNVNLKYGKYLFMGIDGYLIGGFNIIGYSGEGVSEADLNYNYGIGFMYIFRKFKVSLEFIKACTFDGYTKIKGGVGYYF